MLPKVKDSLRRVPPLNLTSNGEAKLPRLLVTSIQLGKTASDRKNFFLEPSESIIIV